MMRAKIAVFMNGAGGLSRVSRKLDPLAIQDGQALSAYLNGNPRSAVAKAEALEKTNPKDPISLN